MNKTITGLLVAAVLLTAAVGVTYPKADTATGPQGQAGAQGERGPVGPRGADGSSVNLSALSTLLQKLQEVVADLKTPKLGAFPGPDLNTPYLSVNGVRSWFNQTTFNKASNTLCAFTAPSASSTLAFTASVKTSTSTELYLVLEDGSVLSASALAAATTSPLRGELTLLAANTTGNVVFSATSTNGLLGTDRNGEVPPNKKVIFHARNAGGGTISQAGSGQTLVGTCNAN